jgi:hypothetical protein
MIDSLYFPLVFLASLVGVGTAGFALWYRIREGAVPLAVFATAAPFEFSPHEPDCRLGPLTSLVPKRIYLT